ncbi:MAG: hypothetical protein E7464_00550 [Ruminococcaceae bacterium]|nr:hypothetical protein [Oscillospiraceae bacterium]
MKPRSVLAVLLAVIMVLSCFPAAAAEPSVQPIYKWDFETVSGSTVRGSGGDATLMGTAAVETAQITIGGDSYSTASNHVLSLKGGSKGSSYADLPSGLYANINANTGFTWTFWMKPDANVGSYTRIISSANSSNENEFAYSPYAQDAVWNVLFDDDNLYRVIYDAEPTKGVWSHIAVSVSAEGISLYVNGTKVSCRQTAEDATLNNLGARLNSMNTLTVNSLGKTNSTWTDNDCVAQVDDVALYGKALSDAEVKAIAESYGIDGSDPGEDDQPPAQDGVYQDGTKLSAVASASSPDDKLAVNIWKDTANRYYYSVSKDEKVIIECSALGMVTTREDLSRGLTLDADSIKITEGREVYDLLAGSTSKVDKAYREFSFDLTKGSSCMTVQFRIFEDGMAYRYIVDGDTASGSEATVITGETSEFTLPDQGTIWTIDLSATYEAYEYTKRTVQQQYSTARSYSTPLLASLGSDGWVLLSEANVYNEADPYCASVFKTDSGKKSFQMRFGRYLVQETNDSYDKQTYSPSYADITSVTMDDVFHTPWRAAIITDTLEDLTNSTLITDLNPPAEGDFSWVVPGGSSWSWWSSSADAIDYNSMKAYIDFTANAGFPYFLVDYGWELWPDYEAKIEELVDYADEKGVGLLLWYGVNKHDNAHIFDLDCHEEIEEAFAWCERMGVKGVKVDYINSDSQFAMEVMYELADLAAQHKLVLNYHGITNPNGENRTYPNILSSEAVAGAENFKWSSGSSIPSLLTLPYTRNVIGPMEFTPTCYPVASTSATAGFHLAMAAAYESAIQTYAASAFVYEGYQGLSLLADIPTTWDESLLLDGQPGESVIRARRNGSNWYIGAMTYRAKTYSVSLDFLDEGKEYTAYIYADNQNGSDIVLSTQKVTSKTVLDLPLRANGGCVVRLSAGQPPAGTVYDDFTYYEAESAVLAGEARTADADFASGLRVVGYVGGNSSNTLTFNNVTVPEAGTYQLRVYYISGESRSLSVKVNDKDPVQVSGLLGIQGDWKAVSARTVEVELDEGTNSIRLFNNSGYTPDIDRIAVSKISADHEHDYDGVITPATCTEQGYTTYTCAKCGDSYVGDETEAIGHNYKEDVCTLCGAKAPVHVCPGAIFSDMPGKEHWAHPGIDYAVANELMNGTGEGKFSPEGTLTRAQLVTILYRVENEPAVELKGTFSDVPADSWYSKAVEWAEANGIVNGIGGGKFAPEAVITREQIATILYRYEAFKNGAPKVEGDLKAFPDTSNVSTFATTAMVWAIENEIITGASVNNVTYLNPLNSATREQIATIIMRYLEAK